jgi:preprotein translocase subunit YajC
MTLATFITFIGMWMLLIFGAMTIFLMYRHKRAVLELNHKERMKALEQGLELPPTPSDGDDRPALADPAHYWRRGLFCTLLGLALMAALGLNAGVTAAAWGLPVLAFGVAYLIIYVSMIRKRPDQTS